MTSSFSCGFLKGVKESSRAHAMSVVLKVRNKFDSHCHSELRIPHFKRLPRASGLKPHARAVKALKAPKMTTFSGIHYSSFILPHSSFQRARLPVPASVEKHRLDGSGSNPPERETGGERDRLAVLKCIICSATVASEGVSQPTSSAIIDYFAEHAFDQCIFFALSGIDAD
jgi:hypothetical protein